MFQAEIHLKDNENANLLILIGKEFAFYQIIEELQ
jgi:hypothetical protein